MTVLANRENDGARALALATLTDIFEQDAYTNVALDKKLRDSELSRKDKALVTELVYGTVSRKLTLEWYLSHYITDRDKLDSWVYHLLMLSLYQLLYLDKLPPYAIVHESVALAKRKKAGAASFINALLRKITSEPLPDIAGIKRVNKRYSIQYSLPVWLVNLLIEEYGEQRALALFESLFIRSKASVRVSHPERLEELAQLTGSQQSELSETGLVKAKGDFARTSSFKDGELTIQDESSQLVAPVLAIQGEERILDACAAPGGKTVHIASYLTTGQVIALDLYDHKLERIQENASRLKLSDKIRTKKLDAREVHHHFGPDYFDKILVDAPCSGIGLIRRKPDIRYRKKKDDLAQLQKIQLSILASVCQTIKKGGIITYSTCTLTKQENFEVIKQFLMQHPEFEQVNLSHSKKEIEREGCLFITPEQYLTDGFFIAQVRRKI